MRRSWILTLGTVPATVLFVSVGAGATPQRKSSPVIVTDQRLTFDPKTCTEGRGMFFWGLGSVDVTVRGHKEGNCVFDYQWEIEGAGSYVVHRVRVPIGSGPVVIVAGDHKDEQEHYWSGVFTSFTKKQATLIRRASFGWCEDLVEGTNQFVAYRTTRREELRPLAVAAEKVTLRFTVYAGDDFKQLAPKAKQGQVVTLNEGQGKGLIWARVAAAGMMPGEVRQVRLPATIAGPAKGWLPGIGDDTILFLEMERTAAKLN